PALRAELRGRVPALAQSDRAAATAPRDEPLARAFGPKNRAWAASLPRLPQAAMQSSYEDGHLEVFIDLGQLPEGFAVDEGDLDPLIVACLYEFVVRQSDGARTAHIKVVRFRGYDEYGAGVTEGATVLHAVELERKSLAALLRGLARKRTGEAV